MKKRCLKITIGLIAMLLCTGVVFVFYMCRQSLVDNFCEAVGRNDIASVRASLESDREFIRVTGGFVEGAPSEFNGVDWWKMRRVRAIFYAHTKEMLELLISYGADVNVRDGEQRTPLHCRIFDRYSYICEKQFHSGLFSYGRDIKAVTAILLTNGANPNAKDLKGSTPFTMLFYDKIEDNEEPLDIHVVEFFLTYGADPNMKTVEAITPLAWAIHRKKTAIVELLKRYGAR
jgi:hypothetical protein